MRSLRNIRSLDWLLVAIAACGAVARLLWALSLPGPVGRDGYFYILQVGAESPFELPVWSTSLLPILLMRVCSMVFDTVAAVKIVTALASFLAVLGAARLVLAISSDHGAAIVAAALATIAAFHNAVFIEFPSNLFGMACFLWTVGAIWAAERDSASKRFRWAVLLLGTATVLSHPTAALALGLFLTIRVLIKGWMGELGSRDGIMLLAVVAFAAAIVVTSYFGRAASPPKVEWGFAPDGLLHHMSGYYSILLWVQAMLILPSCRRKGGVSGNPNLFIATLLVVALAFAANPLTHYSFDLYRAADRLALWGWLLSAVLTPLTFVCLRELSHARSIVCVVIVLAVACGTSFGLPSGADPSYLRRRERLVRDLKTLPPGSLSGRVVVAEHGDQFAVSVITGANAAARPPTDGASAVWLLRSYGQNVEWPRDAIIFGQHAMINNADFEQWLRTRSDMERAAIRRSNPFHVGRDYLDRSVR